MTSNTGTILVFPRIQPFGSDDFSSRGNENSRHVTGSANCVWDLDSSVDPVSLLAEYTVLLLILVEAEGQQELREIEGE